MDNRNMVLAVLIPMLLITGFIIGTRANELFMPAVNDHSNMQHGTHGNNMDNHMNYDECPYEEHHEGCLEYMNSHMNRHRHEYQEGSMYQSEHMNRNGMHGFGMGGC